MTALQNSLCHPIHSPTDPARTLALETSHITCPSNIHWAELLWKVLSCFTNITEIDLAFMSYALPFPKPS